MFQRDEFDHLFTKNSLVRLFSVERIKRMNTQNVYLPPEIWEIITKHFRLLERERDLEIKTEMLQLTKLKLERKTKRLRYLAHDVEQQLEETSRIMRDMNLHISDALALPR